MCSCPLVEAHNLCISQVCSAGPVALLLSWQWRCMEVLFAVLGCVFSTRRHLHDFGYTSILALPRRLVGMPPHFSEPSCLLLAPIYSGHTRGTSCVHFSPGTHADKHHILCYPAVIRMFPALMYQFFCEIMNVRPISGVSCGSML